MAPRRTAHPKKPTPTLGKTSVTKKPIIKQVTTTTTKSHKKATTNITAKTFPCACSKHCSFNAAKIDLRMVLGRPEFNEYPAVHCACKIYYKCAKCWAAAHHELPAVLPCGCGITKRGVDFWGAAIFARRAMIRKKEEEKKQKEEEEKKQKEERERQAEQKKREQLWAEFDWGSDLTDLED
jgi:hypothetical protein